MAMIATFKFDVEDIYYPHEIGIDDISGWTAEIMSEVGLPGTFCVMGAKARTMKKRGREDVLTAMARHELLSHQLDNTHPTLVEILADKDWDEGIEAIAEYEDQVTKDFLYAYGREPAGLTCHDGQWAPQHVGLAAKRKIPFMSNRVGVPGFLQPNWYAGAVCLGHSITNTAPIGEIPSRIALHGEFGGFDTYYGCQDSFDKRLAEMYPYLDDCIKRGVQYVYLFGCHPVSVRARGFLEHYTLAGGKSRTVEELGFLYGVRDRAYEEIAKKNFRRLCEAVRDYPGLEVVTATEAAKYFSTQTEDITIDELFSYAQEVVAANRVLLHRTFSPAELVVGLAESLVAAGTNRPLPDAVKRHDVIGPTTMPTVAFEVISITHERLLKACADTVDFVCEHGRLPGNLYIDNDRLGIGQLIVLAARAYVAQATHHRYAVLDVPEAPRYPDIAHNLDTGLRATHDENPRYDPEMSLEKLARHARLQTWSLKPAWHKPPRGKISYRGRIPLAELTA